MINECGAVVEIKKKWQGKQEYLEITHNRVTLPNI
jgi:hypothetical protein